MAVAVFAPDHSLTATPVPVLSLRVQPPAFIELLNPLSHIAQGGSIVVGRRVTPVASPGLRLGFGLSHGFVPTTLVSRG
jgi:hypothetical protein